MFAPNDHWALLAVLLGAAAFGIWAERTRWGAKLSGAVIAIGTTFVLSNLGVIPSEAPIYGMVWKYLVPLSFACILGVLVLDMLLPEAVPASTGNLLATPLNLLMRLGLAGLGGLLVLVFFWRAWYAYDQDKDKYPGLRGEDQWYPPYYMP